MDLNGIESDVVTIVRAARGRYLGAGCSGIVELLPNGLVIKSPWTDFTEEDCRKEIALEASVYQRLMQLYGEHKRFVKLVAFNDVERTITMEHAANGSLRAYLAAPGTHITMAQRYDWMLAMAEGMELLHSASIVHCDFGPQNMLLDQQLELKVADFACCSMDKGQTDVGYDGRFYPPRTSKHAPITRDHDLCALGSSMYEVLTGQQPFHDVPSPCVKYLSTLRQMPDLADIEMQDVIRDCWLFRAESASKVRARILEAMGQ